MRVVILIEQFFPLTGGGEQQMLELGKALAQLSPHVCVVTRRFRGLARHDNFEGLSVHRLSVPVLLHGGSRFRVLMRKLNAIVFLLSALKFLHEARGRPQVVLVQGGIAFATLIRLPLLASVARIVCSQTKVVIKPWNRPWLERGPERERNVLRSDRDRRSRLKSFLFRFVRDRTDCFVAITSAIRRELVADEVAATKIAAIPNGVDVQRFLPVVEREKQDAKKLLGYPQKLLVTYLGSMKRQKGLDVLLKAWRQVNRVRGDAQLIMVGKTAPEAEFRYLLNLARNLGIEQSVTFSGETHHVRDYLRATDLFVLPSYLEGLSNAMLEALSSGLPTVMTQVPGLEDVIVHGVNGWIVPSGDPGALAEGIIAVLGDSELAAALGKAARELAVERFSIQRVAASYEELIRDLANA